MNLKIREYREAAGMTQTELASLVGKSFRTIQSWERGESFPNALNLWDLARAFETDPDTLMGWWDEHPRTDKPTFADPGQAEVNALYESCGEQGRTGILVNARGMAAIDGAGSRSVPQARLSEAV